jgi:phage terminase large subunit-like protein
VVLCATKKEQAERVVYAEIERMRRASPSITKASSDARRQIKFSGNDGLIMCVGSDRPYDGLNPHSVMMDELHAWCEFHRPFYDTMLTGSGFRDQPLTSYLTTAGDEKSYLWKEVYDSSQKVLRGDVQDDSFFAFIAELDEADDIFDEANWVKANPNLGVSVSIDYLREQATEARTGKIQANRFTRYHCNRIVTSVEQAIDVKEWDACQGELSDWTTADAVGCGVDLGARDDLAAEGYCARFPIGEKDGTPIYRYEIRTQAHIGEDTSRDMTKAPFSHWLHAELIRRNRFPLASLRDSVVERCNAWHVKTVAYDPYNGQSIAEELEREGLTPARMAQNQVNFNEPIRDFLQAVKDGRVRHDGNPLLRWCAGNAVIARDRNDRWMFDKRSSNEKIDPLVAAVMAFRVASLAPARATGPLFIV